MSFVSGYRIKSVSNTINLTADAPKIWQEITNVMLAGFKSPFLLKLLGIPKPLSAEVIKEGVGGYRVATFSNNAQFKQEIHFTRVNRHKNWVIPKIKLRK